MVSQPLSVYINWAAYDELSDAVELTEALAMRQLEELLRLRRAGVRFDAYLMDAFWYDRAGAYRAWRQPHWPQGPDRWLDRCLGNGVKPGLWFAGNNLHQLDVAPAWADSLDESGCGMSLSYGGFLPHWLETARHWYGRGVRLFKLDFFQFGAAPATVRQRYLPSEIRGMNVEALRQGLRALRAECPEIVLLGYNGFEEAETITRTDIPFRKSVDPRWLETFDSLYCGDPRPADVPAMNFWRSKDVYSDHMVRVYERNGFPLARIDNAGFMIGTTGTCYGRNTAAWRGMLVLSLARGGWINTYYGNLDLLGDEEGAWFAKVQALFMGLQASGHISTFGGMPGDARPYGYVAAGATGSLITVVNPAQAVETVPLPGAVGGGRVLFCDAGPVPVLAEGGVRLGPEQMAVIGVGSFSGSAFDLGREAQVRIPASMAPLPVAFQAAGDKELRACLQVPPTGVVRVILRQYDAGGKARRTTGGAPPAGTTLGRLIGFEVTQGETPVPVRIQYDKAIWSGLSWAVGEFDTAALLPGRPVQLRCFTREQAGVALKAEVRQVTYGSAWVDG